MDGRGDHFVRGKEMHEQTDRADIGHRVHGTDFMKMDKFDRASVHAAFSLGDQGIDRQDILPDCIRKRQGTDDGLDLLHAASVMMPVLMLMVVFVLMLMVMMMFMLMLFAVCFMPACFRGFAFFFAVFMIM